MKRFAKIVVLLVLLAILCSVLAGCGIGTDEKAPQIVYGKEYRRFEEMEKAKGEYSCFVFEEDNTGYYCDGYSGSKTFFIWEVAEDGFVYLFPTKTVGDDGTVGKPYGGGLTGSYTFGEGFMIWTGGAGSARYVLEGSDLEEAITKE